jgi:hypothetical protein
MQARRPSHFDFGRAFGRSWSCLPVERAGIPWYLRHELAVHRPGSWVTVDEAEYAV